MSHAEEVVEIVAICISFLTTFSWLFFGFYVIKRHIKKMDVVFIGAELRVDNLFHQYLRLADYTFTCTFDLYARRVHPNTDLARIDKKLKHPFVICGWLFVVAVASLIFASLVVEEVE